MNADTLLENFDVLAEATDGISRLRELVVALAVSGQIVKMRMPDDDTVDELLQCAARDVDPYPEMSKKRFDIPLHWTWVPLASIARHQLGKMLNTGKMKGARVKYLRSVNVRQDGRIDLSDVKEMLIPVDELEKYSVKSGDIFVNEGGDVGRNAIWLIESEEKFAFQNQLHRLRPICGISSRYLQLVFRDAKSRGVIAELSSGVTIQHFSASSIRKLAIPLPPLAEQRRIVARVDELMALCDQLEQQQKHRDNLRAAARESAINAISTATTPEELQTEWKRINNNWEVIADTPESVESLRELILDLAVRGDLGITEISDAKAPILWDVEEQRLDVDKLWKLDTMHLNPANGWSRLPLARLGTWGSGGTPTASRKEFYNNGSIPWAVIGDLNNGIMTDTSSKITQKALTSSSAKLIPKNAVLIAMYGASIGKTAVTGIECTTNQAIAHCIVDESVVSTEYFFLVAKSLKKHLIKVGKGAAQPNISQTVLKHLLIDVPQLNAQQIVVSKVNELMALCDQLESMLKSRSELAEKFAQSVVNAA